MSRGAQGMQRRTHAVVAVVRLKLREASLNPGYYIWLAIALAVVYFLARTFVAGVDGAGFVCGGASLHAAATDAWATCYERSPLYAIVGRAITAAFGVTFADSLLAEGPFQIGLLAAFAPPCVFIALATVLGQGLEKRVGAIELVTYGPADGAAFFIGTLVRDLILVVGTLLIISLFCLAVARGFNLALGSRFLPAALAYLLVAAAFLAFGLVANALVDGPAAATALLGTVGLVSGALFVASYALVGGYVASLSTVIAAAVQWVSPLYYLGLAYVAVSSGDTLGYLLSLLGLLGLIGVCVVGGYLLARSRGVRGA